MNALLNKFWHGRAMPIALAIAVAVGLATYASFAFAQVGGLHGIGFVKGCESPTQIGGPYRCVYAVFNNSDTGTGVPGSADTLKITSIVDTVHAAPDVVSSNLLPSLTLHFTGGASCNVGQTECTLPPGSSITSDPFSFYTTDSNDPSPLTDTANLTWRDTCDSGANNCPIGDQHSTSGSQTTLVKAMSTTTTEIRNAQNQDITGTTVNAGTIIHDHAVVTGAGSTTPTGTVTFNLFNNNNCSGTPSATESGVALVNGAADSAATTTSGTGMSYLVSYSGDGLFASSTAACEPLTVLTKASPTISTVLSTTSVAVGASVSDSATLSGATSDAGGSVTYTVFSDTACSADPRSAGTKTVTNGVVPDSDALTFSTAGTFYWQAVYSGDAKNNAATSTCTSEILTVVEPPPQNLQYCSPGYWKQSQHFDSWVDYLPTQKFSAVFGETITIMWSAQGKPQPVNDPTLLQALEANGGGINQLARATVDALLNASALDSGFTPAEVISMFQAVHPGTNAQYQALASQFTKPENCPLN